MGVMKDRMLRGELYIADDPALAADHARAQELLDRYNATLHSEQDERDRLLRSLLGGVGKGVVATPGRGNTPDPRQRDHRQHTPTPPRPNPFTQQPPRKQQSSAAGAQRPAGAPRLQPGLQFRRYPIPWTLGKTPRLGRTLSSTSTGPLLVAILSATERLRIARCEIFRP